MNRTPILSAMIGSAASDEPAAHLVRKTMGSNPIKSFLFSFVGRLTTSAFVLALSLSELFFSTQERSAYLLLIGVLILALGIATLVDAFRRRNRDRRERSGDGAP
jgi:hypothetical protein